MKQISKGIWEIPKQGKMLVPARIYSTKKLMENIEEDAKKQLINVAELKGIQKYSIAEPDCHVGYGFPIGGVAAFDSEKGVVSPGGIGFDVNCTCPETKISLGNGSWLTIKELERNFDLFESNSFDKNKNELIKTKPVFYMKREETGFLYEIKTKTSRKLKVTGEHPIFTKTGMKKAEELEKEFIAAHPFKGVKYTEPSDEIIITKENIENLLEELRITSKGSAKQQIMKYLKKLNVLPLKYNSAQTPALLRLSGFVFGDGVISLVNKKKGITSFYAKEEDLEAIKKDILSLGFKAPTIYKRNRKHRIKTFYGESNFEFEETSLVKKSTAFAALLIALGVPFGKKTQKEYRVPKWIMKGETWQKRLFLASFFGAELSSPKTLNKYNFYSPQLNMNKNEKLKENTIDFLNDIRLLLSEFDIKSSYPVEVKGYQYNGKMGKTVGLRLKIAGKNTNLIKLYEKIGFEYNREKQKKACLAASYARLKEKITKERNDAREEAKN
ncbi:RtcB family protein, partial [Candidatus Micrarchaeota archaeon]|nr:RtcB family protein [Candidatus Micrarchaeota archaeon]